MYAEAISNTLWECLKGLSAIPAINSAYLGGGTALALQLGHRKSDDLDFFISEQFDRILFKKDIDRIFPGTILINETPRHTEFLIQSIKIDLISEQIPLCFPLKTIKTNHKALMAADAKDIGRMKLLSIGSRGSKKDFVDLYCITRDVIELESLITMAMGESSGIKYSKLLFLKGLVDFEEADRDGPLEMIWDIDWPDIKNVLMEVVRKIAKKIQLE